METLQNISTFCKISKWTRAHHGKHENVEHGLDSCHEIIRACINSAIIQNLQQRAFATWPLSESEAGVDRVSYKLQRFSRKYYGLFFLALKYTNAIVFCNH